MSFRKLLCGSSALLLVVVAAACEPSWPALGHDASRSGHNPSETSPSVGNVGDLQEVWSAKLPSNGAGSSPVVAGGSVFVASGRLRVYDAAGAAGCSGTPRLCEPIWTAAAGGIESPTVGGNVVYTTSDGTLYAYDARGTSGCGGTPKVCAPVWQAAIGGGLGSPAVVGDTVYVGGGPSRRLFAFDADGSTGCSGTPRTCTPRWTSSGAAGATPAVAHGFVYTVAAYGEPPDSAWQLRAYDADGQDGCSGSPRHCAPRWRADIEVGCGVDGGCGVLGPPSVGDGRVHVVASSCCGGGESHSDVVSFDADGVEGCSGTTRRCRPLAEASGPDPTLAAPRSPVAVANGQVFLGDLSLVAYEAPELERRWRSYHVALSSPSVANGVVYVMAADQSKVFPAAFDTAGEQGCSGSPPICMPLWSGRSVPTTVGDAITSEWSPPVVADGTVFVRLGRLRAYRLTAAG